MALGQKAVSYEMLMEAAIDNAVTFQQITNNLTPHDLQARATAQPCGHLGEFNGYNDEGYQPAREDGWFDADSVENCLRKIGFDFVRVRNNEAWCRDFHSIKGRFIINRANVHWFAIWKWSTDSSSWLLDSINDYARDLPTDYSSLRAIIEVDEQRNELCTIFEIIENADYQTSNKTSIFI
jgi:hypothetical protein